ncbi:MAG: AEC family transporter [Lentisphaerae bacterium]|nr:AEC family transporter [Lentisphaerota bacterium]
MRILSIVFPVFAIIGLGYGYGRGKRLDLGMTNQIAMDVLVPALVFSALASQAFDTARYAKLALGGAAVVLGSGLLAYPFARLLKVQVKTFVPPMMFSNSGNMGIPVMVLACGDAAVPGAVVLFLVEMLLHFSLGAFLLDRRMRGMRWLRSPVMLATLLGLGVSLSGATPPAPVSAAVRTVGDAAIPLLLFALGVRLNEISFQDWRLGLAGALLCPATGLAMVALIAPALALAPLERSLLLIFGALPPAVLNYLMAEQYRQEPERVASIVLLGNLAALGVMPIVLAFALH